MIRWSVLAAVVGVVLTWLATARLGRQGSGRPPEVYWLLGLAALFPAWLIVFLGLIEPAIETLPETFVAVWWILSASTALLGVIVGDAVVRRFRESGRPYPRARYWLVGVVGFFPAWGIALLAFLKLVSAEGP